MKREKKEVLKPMFENVKSYYNKAYIIEEFKGVKQNRKDYYTTKKEELKTSTLYSYNTKIMSITKCKDSYKIDFNYKDINNKNIYSMTTLRHIKEYIKQNKRYLYYYFDIINKENITKKDINTLINTNYNKLIKEI